MRKLLISSLLGLCLLLGTASNVIAHCDTMEGPVVIAANQALEKKDVNPVLIWVREESEPEVKSVFEKTLTAGKQGKEAKELADMYFFETVVRLHRAGEGEPYTGLKPAGAHVCEVIPAGDKALESNSEAALLQMVQDKVKQGVTELFLRVQEKKKNISQSVEAGREYVEAYVTFMHYVESVYETANLSCEKHSEQSSEIHRQEE